MNIKWKVRVRIKTNEYFGNQMLDSIDYLP